MNLLPGHRDVGARTRARTVVVTALAGAFVLAGCGAADDPVAGTEFLGMDADHLVVNTEVLITAMGVRRATILGDTGYVYEDSGVTELASPRVTLYDERGEQSGSLTSDRGQVESATDAMVARGNVVLITHDGKRIETEELHYDPQVDRVWSDVATTLYEDGTTVHGTGFTSDANLQTIRVRDPTARVEGVEIER